MPSKPSASAATYAATRSAARKACGVWTPSSSGGATRPSRASRPGSADDRDRAAVLARGRDRGREQVRTGQRPGAVVDRDHVDLAGVDRGPSARSAAHSEACRVAPPSTRPTSAPPRYGASASADLVAARRGAPPRGRTRGTPLERRSRRAPTRPARAGRRAGAAPCWSRHRRANRSRRRGSRRRRAPAESRSGSGECFHGCYMAKQVLDASPLRSGTRKGHWMTPAADQRRRSGSRSAGSSSSLSSAARRRWCTARRSRSSAPRTTRSTRWATTTRSPRPRCSPRASSAPGRACPSSPRRRTSTPSTCAAVAAWTTSHVSVPAYDVRVVEGVVLVGHRKVDAA